MTQERRWLPPPPHRLHFEIFGRLLISLPKWNFEQSLQMTNVLISKPDLKRILYNCFDFTSLNFVLICVPIKRKNRVIVPLWLRDFFWFQIVFWDRFRYHPTKCTNPKNGMRPDPSGSTKSPENPESPTSQVSPDSPD